MFTVLAVLWWRHLAMLIKPVGATGNHHLRWLSICCRVGCILRAIETSRISVVRDIADCLPRWRCQVASRYRCLAAVIGESGFEAQASWIIVPGYSTVCSEIKFSGRHRGFDGVLFNLWPLANTGFHSPGGHNKLLLLRFCRCIR